MPYYRYTLEAGILSIEVENRLGYDEGMATAKVKEIIHLIEQDGWFIVTTRGSHRQYKHAVKPGRVTIAGKPSDDLASGTLNSILKQAQL